MQVALLLLFLVIFSIILFLSLTDQKDKDGFIDIDEMHSNYVTRQLKQWGDVGVSLVAGKKIGVLGESGDKMLQTAGEKPGSYPLYDEKDGLWKIIDKCESIKTMDCSAFDDPEFATSCGMCLDIGENSDKAKVAGGLVLLPDDKKIAKERTRADFIPDYKPTIGFCPAKKMVATKEECLKLQRQLLCEKNASFDLPGCSQCFSDISYSIVDPKTSPGVISDSGTIMLVGAGILNIHEQGFDAKTNIRLNEKSPYSYDIRGSEGNRIKLSLQPPADSDPYNPTVPHVGGILSGDTTTGTFTSDLRRIVMVDEMTGRKPRSRGRTTLSGTTITRMAPGFGQTTATIVVIVPFSFADTGTSESTMCKDGPFVTKLASAEFLESDPCYKKGSGPGKYSLECLQGSWDSNGCTESGKGYPKDSATATELMTGKDGTFLSINDISDFIYNKALITATGVDEEGNKLKIQDWSAASVFCTGEEITSPCDVEARKNGPLPVDCLQYLWNNEGAKNKRTGETYSMSNIFGLSYFDFKKADLRGCQPSGTLSPVDINGNKNQAAIQFWHRKGGVNAVKSVMNNIHATANSKTFMRDEQRMEAFNWCYGPKELAKRPDTIQTCPGNVLPKSFSPIRGKILRKFTMTQDYKLEFDIIIKSTTNTWGNIIRISQPNGNIGFGDRTPGIWVVPNNWGGGGGNLHVRLGDPTDPNWGFDSLVGCTIGKKSHFSLECKGDSVTVKIDDKTYTMKQPEYRYNGPVVAYAGDPDWHSANASLWNVCLQLTGNSKVSSCPTALLPSSFIPRQGAKLGELTMTQDYKLEFDIIPRGIIGNWGSIIQFTNDGNRDCCELGWRTPAIWLWPNGLGMHVRVGDATHGSWGLDNGPNDLPGLEIGKKSRVSLECSGNNVTLKIDSRTFTKTQPTYRYSGPLMVYGSNPWHPPANCSILNLCLTTAGNSTKVTDIRQDMTFNNVNINGGGANHNRYLGNFPDIAACAAAGRKAHPTGNYAVTWGGNDKQCWVIGSTNPYDRHFNPQPGWTSTYFRPPGERLAGIAGVTRVQLAGSGAHDQNINISQLVVLDDLGRNISRGRPTEGSGQWGPQTHSGRAVDGGEWPRSHPDSYHDGGPAKNITHWEVKLDGPSTVSAIIIYNRADCCQHRLATKNMHFFNSAGDLIYWKPNMGTALVNVLPTNSSTNQAAQTKNHFNAYCYSNRYRDLYNAFDAPNGPANNAGALHAHYVNHGQREGRNPNC